MTNSTFDVLRKNAIIDQLFAKEIISLRSPLTLDDVSALRTNFHLLSSFPQLLKDIAVLFKDLPSTFDYNLIASPYTDIPLATTVALTYDWPMIFARKERKEYGKGTLVEGKFSVGDKVLIIDDQLDDFGASLQLIGRLEGSGLKVAGYCVLFADDSSGFYKLAEKYVTLSVFDPQGILMRLIDTGIIRNAELERIKTFYRSNKKILSRV